jgi:hypothetical protein
MENLLATEVLCIQKVRTEDGRGIPEFNALNHTTKSEIDWKIIPNGLKPCL